MLQFCLAQEMVGILNVTVLFSPGNVVVSGVDPYHDPHCGGKQVIVHLFEWKWTDIAKECERYLGPKGFCGVQVSPPMEHAMITTDGDRPWWERYQPISYKLVSRSGNEEQLKDMVQRCKAAGVRVYVDAVVNHMAGLGRKGVGTAGSTFDSDAKDFPGVPFTKENFNDRSDCPSHDGNVNNYGDPKNVRDCYLVGLTDLKASQPYVQDKISGYFNHLIDLGVAGFRVDAAKHMWPKDLEAILTKTHDLPEGGRPFFYHEVIDRNDGAIKVNEYFHLGYVTEFRYSQKVKEGASGDLGRLGAVYDPGWGMAPPDQAFVFVDNHDTQRGNEALTYKNGAEYKRAVAFTLAYNYGFTRVMSSYYFTDNSAGPPRNADMSAKDVIIKADGSCDNGWVCEHRWKPIGNMAMFRNAVAGTSVDNFKYDNGVLSFNRGNKGFFAMSVNSFSISVNTGLPAGEYCDLISECAQKIRVDGTGHAQISPKDPTEPFVAIITLAIITRKFDILVAIIPRKFDILVAIITCKFDILVAIITRKFDILVAIITCKFDILVAIITRKFDILVAIITRKFEILVVIITCKFDILVAIITRKFDILVTIITCKFDILVAIITRKLDIIVAIITRQFDIIVAIITRKFDIIVAIITRKFDILVAIITSKFDILVAIITRKFDILVAIITCKFDILVAIITCKFDILVAIITRKFDILVAIITRKFEILVVIITCKFDILVAIITRKLDILVAIITRKLDIIVAIITRQFDIIVAIITRKFDILVAIITRKFDILVAIITCKFDILVAIITRKFDILVAIITQGGESIVVPIVPDQGGGDHSGGQTQTPADSNQSTLQPTEAVTVPTTTQKPYVPSGQEDFQRTIIMVERQTNPGQDLFIRGGVDYTRRPGCSASLPAATNPCAIPLKHQSYGTSTHFDKINAWSEGDNFLDWSGPEPGQGSYQGRAAEGSPAFWSTNDKTNAGYSDLNTYGPHYWIIDLVMDCSRTEDSFFELKAIVNGGWESDLGVTPACSGLGSTSPPFVSKNHVARCGYKNVFHFNSPACEISPL
ncbi:Alpha-amylase A type-1/2 [Bulinus truncatus]|nr:Alpha-amylase A type-1/2 [Bulinus truncatus]